ncbi:MAG: FAD-binding oxidoreductase [Limisphaerales bacterium]
MNTSEKSVGQPVVTQASTVVNDCHSRLNATAVKRILRPESLVQLSEIIKGACARRVRVSIAGGRHAMGGQQFSQNAVLIDTTALDRVLEFDPALGTVRCEAGATWPRLLEQLRQLQPNSQTFWTFAQKQTGADQLTLGGAVAANIHGRGLTMKPFIQDVLSLDLVDADGKLIRCSRAENGELFRLVVGGYGLFGVVYAVTLQLVERQALRRIVQIAEIDELIAGFDNALARGASYGDFQFGIDPSSDHFLRRGVFAVYEPAPREKPDPGAKRLGPEDWERMVYLAHTDKTAAYREYTGFYQSTHGQVYWSDTQQFNHYSEGYHQRIDQCTGAGCPGSEMITELYVPRRNLPAFMQSVRMFARRYGWNIIYGTVRLIERDNETFLAWAREAWTCVVLNLCVQHSPRGMEEAKNAFRCLIQIAINYSGSYYLTYHKWATPDQMLACYPQLPEFIRHKRRFDPDEVFVSNWYYSHRNLFPANE